MMDRHQNGFPRSSAAHFFLSRSVLVLACMAPLFSGCLYFNLFYNAETSFDTALKAHQKLLKNNPDSAITLPAEIETGYKKTVDKCLKVFEIYPKDKKTHDKALFLMAKADYYLGEYDKTIRLCAQLQREYPASLLVPESYLFTGRAQLKKGNLEEAEKTLAIAQVRYPALDKRQDVSMLMADIVIRRQGKAQAVAMLEAAYKSAKTPDRKMELAIKIAQLYRDLKLYDKAIAVLRGAPRVKDLTDQLYRLDYLLVLCLSDKEEYAQALGLVNSMLVVKQYYSRTPLMMLRKAELLEKLDKLDQAVAAYKQVTESANGGDAVGVAWFEMGFLYQSRLIDLKKAKECYDKALLSLKDPDLKDTATKRSKAIDTILKYGEGKKPVDTAKIEGASGPDFKVGELYWLELDRPDSAFRYFCAATRDTQHRALIPKALYAAAWIARYSLKDSVRADSLYRVLLSKYPSNLFSQKAQAAHGDKITVFTREDSARAAFEGAESIFLEDNNPDSAAEAYMDAYRRFPDSDFGPKSLYAAAWIYDNVLDKNRTAKGLYEMLCDSFPKSSYCLNEAKPRLKTVADSLAAFKSRRKSGASAAPQSPGKPPQGQTASVKTPADTGLQLLSDKDSSRVPASQPGAPGARQELIGAPPGYMRGMYRGTMPPNAPAAAQQPPVQQPAAVPAVTQPAAVKPDSTAGRSVPSSAPATAVVPPAAQNPGAASPDTSVKNKPAVPGGK
jgi:tetratricopeptide (TPR) repeat protein